MFTRFGQAKLCWQSLLRVRFFTSATDDKLHLFERTDRRDEFERALRARLAPSYEEQVRFVALLGRRRDE